MIKWDGKVTEISSFGTKVDITFQSAWRDGYANAYVQISSLNLKS